VQKGAREDILIPTEVAKVIDEYVDVIPNEIPDGLLLHMKFAHLGTSP
jgi:hypothetical protein